MKKIAVITSTRAEYGLLFPLIKELMQEKTIQMHLLVSGTHLLEKYGYTVDYIMQDGLPIAYEIPIFDEGFISDEEHVSIAIAEAVKRCGFIFAKEKYDALVVLGDRYELLGFCTAAVVCRIPIVHIHGGEITEGAIDDKIRHAVTKLASIHFPSLAEYADRIIQMGENPDNVYAVGALGMDNIMKLQLLEREQWLSDLDIHTKRSIAAVTYHPVTGENPEMAVQEIRQVLEALLCTNVFSVITMPNSDVGGDMIYETIVSYAEKNPERMVLKKSLGQLRYLSLLKHADVMVGNSSSGIIESASFGLPTVDIGERQKGRMAPDNVIHCSCNKQAIIEAITRALTPETKRALSGYNNPYGDGKAAQRMVSILKTIDFSDSSLVCKKFYDIG